MNQQQSWARVTARYWTCTLNDPKLTHIRTSAITSFGNKLRWSSCSGSKEREKKRNIQIETKSIHIGQSKKAKNNHHVAILRRRDSSSAAAIISICVLWSESCVIGRNSSVFSSYCNWFYAIKYCNQIDTFVESHRNAVTVGNVWFGIQILGIQRIDRTGPTSHIRCRHETACWENHLLISSYVGTPETIWQSWVPQTRRTATCTCPSHKWQWIDTRNSCR